MDGARVSSSSTLIPLSESERVPLFHMLPPSVPRKGMSDAVLSCHTLKDEAILFLKKVYKEKALG